MSTHTKNPLKINTYSNISNGFGFSTGDNINNGWHASANTTSEITSQMILWFDISENGNPVKVENLSISASAKQDSTSSTQAKIIYKLSNNIDNNNAFSSWDTIVPSTNIPYSSSSSTTLSNDLSFDSNNVFAKYLGIGIYLHRNSSMLKHTVDFKFADSDPIKITYRNLYGVSKTITGNGTISNVSGIYNNIINGYEYAIEDSSLSFTVSPNTYYDIDRVLINNTETTPVQNTYTKNNIQNSVDIKAILRGYRNISIQAITDDDNEFILSDAVKLYQHETDLLISDNNENFYVGTSARISATSDIVEVQSGEYLYRFDYWTSSDSENTITSPTFQVEIANTAEPIIYTAHFKKVYIMYVHNASYFTYNVRDHSNNTIEGTLLPGNIISFEVPNEEFLFQATPTSNYVFYDADFGQPPCVTINVSTGTGAFILEPMRCKMECNLEYRQRYYSITLNNNTVTPSKLKDIVKAYKVENDSRTQLSYTENTNSLSLEVEYQDKIIFVFTQDTEYDGSMTVEGMPYTTEYEISSVDDNYIFNIRVTLVQFTISISKIKYGDTTDSTLIVNRHDNVTIGSSIGTKIGSVELDGEVTDYINNSEATYIYLLSDITSDHTIEITYVTDSSQCVTIEADNCENGYLQVVFKKNGLTVNSYSNITTGGHTQIVRTDCDSFTVSTTSINSNIFELVEMYYTFEDDEGESQQKVSVANGETITLPSPYNDETMIYHFTAVYRINTIYLSSWLSNVFHSYRPEAIFVNTPIELEQPSYNYENVEVVSVFMQNDTISTPVQIYGIPVNNVDE